MTDRALFTLARTQATTERWTFANRLTGDGPDDPAATWQNMHEWDAYGEIRSREKGGDLLLSLTEYLTVVDDDDGDGRWLVLLLPGAADVSVDYPVKPGWFDVFLRLKTDHAVDQLLVQGEVTVDPATTDMTAAEA